MSAVSCSRLIHLCLQCAATQQSQRVTLSSHVDSFIAASDELKSDEIAASTLREILYGLSRYKKLLSVTIDGLYARYAASIARSDRPLYEIFTVLAIYKVAELGMAEFRTYVLSQEAHKMHALLSFLYTEEMLDSDGWLKQQWSTVYDHVHVEEKMLGGMRAILPQMTALLSELSAAIAHASNLALKKGEQAAGEATRVPKKESTVPEPFQLTQPKVKMLPTPPIQMDAVYKASPIPEPTPSLQQLEIEALKRRRAQEEATAKKHKAAKGPQLSTEQRGKLTHRASEKLRLEMEAAEKEAKQAFAVKPAPVFKDVAPPKLTTAAILREDQLYKRRQEEKLAQLAKFESELRDADEFHAWQLKMEAEDSKKRDEEIQRRKDDSRQSAIDAVLAIAKAAEEKHELVVGMREDLRVINEAKVEARRKEMEAKQVLVQKVEQEKQAIPIAVNAVIEKKIAKAEEIANMKLQAEKEKKEAKKLELIEKKRIIKEIQAMEKLANTRAKRPKEIDPTSTSGYGFLDEMSLVELQARSALLKQKEAVYIAEKRAEILRKKQQKAMVLEEMQRNHQTMKKEIKSAFIADKTTRLETQAAKEKAAKEKLEAEAVILKEHLTATAEQKRKEAMRLVKELKEKKIQNEFYAHTRAALDAQRVADLEKALARVEAQKLVVQNEQEKNAAIVAYQTEKSRVRAEKAKKRELEAVRHAADVILAEHRVDGVELAAEDSKLKGINRREVRDAILAQQAKQRTRNPYAEQIAQREAKRAARLAKAAEAGATRALENMSLSDDADDDDHIEAAAEARREREEREAIRALDLEVTKVAKTEEEKTAPSAVAASSSAVTSPISKKSAAQQVKETQSALASITQKRASPSPTAAASAKKTASATSSAKNSARSTTKQPLAARA